MDATLPIQLNDAAIENFGRELDALIVETRADLGERDARYIRRLIAVQRSLALGGRVAIFASLATSGTLFASVIALGVAALGIAKILENMEIGHNVLHGQWDWMRDPEIQSNTWEWDHGCPADQWRHSHNVRHHAWTNVLGEDRDVGYGMLRMSDAQRWSPFYLLQPLNAVLMAVLFEWFVAIHDLELNRILKGKKDKTVARRQWRDVLRKVGRQSAKDYLLFPLLAGPYFLTVLAADAAANLIRNVWTWIIIFCGHFPDGVHVFTREQVAGETRGRWYVRQLLGSCNIEGSKLFHVMTGNLSHQIEHHLFPDLASNRYPEIAPRVRALCARYGLPYHTGPLGKQIGSTIAKIVRLTVPTSRAAIEATS